MRIAVIGFGSGGKAIAGHLALNGHDISVFDRDESKIEALRQNPSVKLSGRISGCAKIRLASTHIAEVIDGADLIMVVTVANAHKDVAAMMAPYLQDNQVVVLNPGRTGGALEFRNMLRTMNVNKRIYLAEAQTLIYACRQIDDNTVNIIGVKDKVLLSALPSSDTPHVLSVLSKVYSCFYAAENVLHTGFENVGAMFHPAVVVFNEAAIERGSEFYFYRDMTPALAHLIEEIDKERLKVAKAYDIELVSAADWVSLAYNGVRGDTLRERMRNNPAYYEIMAPTTINCRQITEDIPTGIIPISELGKVACVPTPNMDALITICSTLINADFRANGRTLQNLGIDNMSKKEILDYLR